MSTFLLLLQSVHDSVHDIVHKRVQILNMKKNYSEPKIYTGGVEISQWNKLSIAEQQAALSKSWYIYYSFRNKENGKLERLPNIKGEANKYKTKQERYEYLSILRDTLLNMLEKGYTPYEDNDFTLEQTTETTIPKATPEVKKSAEKKPIAKEEAIKEEVTETKPSEVVISDPKNTVMTLEEAFDFALKIKKASLGQISFQNFQSRIRRFQYWTDDNQPITSLTKKTVMDYLNEMLESSSPRNRNNYRTDLSSLFQVLEDNEIIPVNFIKKINVIKTKAERNKTYTPEMQGKIFEYLEEHDPHLLLYIKFLCYNFLRPIEVCRLKIEDIDTTSKTLTVKAKNKLVKTKIIPDILFQELPDLTQFKKSNYLFTPVGLGQEWDADENNRRDNFSKRFKKVVKEHFNLNADYGLYSFRHTFITKLYRELRKSFSPFETKSRMMLITGHSTMSALEEYLRDIDAEIPEDYSDLLR